MRARLRGPENAGKATKPVASEPPTHKSPTPIRLEVIAASSGTTPFLASVTTMTSRQAKLQEDTHFRVMRILQENPDLTQRELAERVGVSVGGLNYCLKALMEKGLVKMKNFANSKNKFGYVYVLTPRGMAEKAAITHRFLQRKVEEYEALKTEIQALQSEVWKTGGAGSHES